MEQAEGLRETHPFGLLVGAEINMEPHQILPADIGFVEKTGGGEQHPARVVGGGEQCGARQECAVRVHAVPMQRAVQQRRDNGVAAGVDADRPGGGVHRGAAKQFAAGAVHPQLRVRTQQEFLASWKNRQTAAVFLAVQLQVDAIDRGGIGVLPVANVQAGRGGPRGGKAIIQRRHRSQRARIGIEFQQRRGGLEFHSHAVCGNA